MGWGGDQGCGTMQWGRGACSAPSLPKQGSAVHGVGLGWPYTRSVQRNLPGLLGCPKSCWGGFSSPSPVSSPAPTDWSSSLGQRKVENAPGGWSQVLLPRGGHLGYRGRVVPAHPPCLTACCKLQAVHCRAWAALTGGFTVWGAVGELGCVRLEPDAVLWFRDMKWCFIPQNQAPAGARDQVLAPQTLISVSGVKPTPRLETPLGHVWS